MSSDQINTSNYSSDDYSGFHPHKHSATSRENSKFGPSMNPDLFLPNPSLGGNPVSVPHLQKYAPTESNPTEQSLLAAKLAASECSLIKTNLSEKWLGIDYSDPNAAYNCFCNDEPGAPPGPKTDFWVSGVFPTPNSDSATFVNLPADVANAAPEYIPPTYGAGDCGTNFDKYIEISKTNATFWNTPPKTPLLRRAQTALLMYNRIRILVHGDFTVKPGNIIKIDYTFKFNNNNTIDTSRFDGNWMVYKVQHIITGVKHSMYLFLMRDGSEVPPSKYSQVHIEMPEEKKSE